MKKKEIERKCVYLPPLPVSGEGLGGGVKPVNLSPNPSPRAERGESITNLWIDQSGTNSVVVSRRFLFLKPRT
jgi:hypothetical protein